jgi:hypothetical protein
MGLYSLYTYHLVSISVSMFQNNHPPLNDSLIEINSFSISDEFTLILHNMKKILFLLVLILAVGCNSKVCPAYTDSTNKMQSTIFNSGSSRADGIHRVYRDSPHKR